MTHMPEYLTTHVVAGDRLVYALDKETGTLAKLAQGGGRRGLALTKQPGLGVVLVAMEKDNVIGPHAKAGPTTIQVLQGQVAVELTGETVNLGEHQIAVLGPDVEHTVVARQPSVLLVTVAGQEQKHEHG